MQSHPRAKVGGGDGIHTTMASDKRVGGGTSMADMTGYAQTYAGGCGPSD